MSTFLSKRTALKNFLATGSAQNRTKAYNAKVLNCTDDPSYAYTLCYSSGETIYHLVSASPALAATEYLKRQNFVALIIQKNVFYEISTCKKRWL